MIYWHLDNREHRVDLVLVPCLRANLKFSQTFPQAKLRLQITIKNNKQL